VLHDSATAHARVILAVTCFLRTGRPCCARCCRLAVVCYGASFWRNAMRTATAEAASFVTGRQSWNRMWCASARCVELLILQPNVTYHTLGIPSLAAVGRLLNSSRHIGHAELPVTNCDLSILFRLESSQEELRRAPSSQLLFLKSFSTLSINFAKVSASVCSECHNRSAARALSLALISAESVCFLVHSCACHPVLYTLTLVPAS
jgi:hypothetical protein